MRKDSNGAGRKVAQRLFAAVDVLPLVVPTALAAFSAVVVFFLLLGQLRTLYVWPVGLLAAFFASYATIRYGRTAMPGTKKEQRICGLLVLCGAVVWMGFNALYTTQHVFVNRDPGFYTVTGGWLIDHHSIYIPTSHVFGDVPGVESPSAGFGADPQTSGQLDAQGAHLLPAVLGLIGRIVGPGRMLHLNVVFGGAALLAVYAFARLVVRPRWALISTAGLALCLPLLYFSRDMYTEPLAMTFTFGALALLWMGLQSRRLPLWFLAGLVAGAGALTRIDAYLTVAALLVFVILSLALSLKGERKEALKKNGLFLIGMSMTSVLGWLDIFKLSANYYVHEWSHLKPELLLLVALAVLGVIVVPVCWKTNLVKWLDDATRSWRAPVAVTLIVLIGVGLAARPLFYKAYSINAVQMANGATKMMTTRNYSEETVEWVVWYIGPIIAALGLVGLALATYKSFKRRDLLFVGPLLVVLATSLLYLINPKIARDQIWASRRLLPVILPGIAVFAGLGLQWLYEQKWTRRFSVDGRILTTVLATLALMAPLAVSAPFLRTRENTLYQPLEATCNALPENAAVLWIGTARTRVVQATRTFCHKPSEGYGKLFNNQGSPSVATLKMVAKNAQENGYLPVIGLYGNEANLLSGKSRSLSTVSVYNSNVLETTFTSPPRNVIAAQNSIMLGVIQRDGSVTPLE